MATLADLSGTQRDVRERPGLWQSHVTRKETTFDERSMPSRVFATFECDGWELRVLVKRILVSRDDRWVSMQ